MSEIVKLKMVEFKTRQDSHWCSDLSLWCFDVLHWFN